MYSYWFHFAIVIAMFAASQVEAQMNFQQLGTRRGAVAGAIIGGIIGGENDEVAAGIITGGLIGGAAGNIIGSRMDLNRGYYPTPVYPQAPYQQPYYNGYQAYSKPYVQPSYPNGPNGHPYSQPTPVMESPQFHPAYRNQTNRNRGSGWQHSTPSSATHVQAPTPNHSRGRAHTHYQNQNRDGFVPPPSRYVTVSPDSTTANPPRAPQPFSVLEPLRPTESESEAPSPEITGPE